ncbi:ketopantoate reductase family protein [Pimelobacter simplex]|uniref:2-dehydropantoate 2-reductase n=1 Tax=Nocardioides simplex TaxID=2045 RepID=A0A7J5E380_NOCSI|nr:2-dehydropantoate 2-reductase [Pimelobacter simplex]KAB2812711.1 ketopantoate reductase family protein [Pimelobacter simplex]
MSIDRIAVLGTGANGASIGADLVRAGYDVTYIEQWPAHVEAIRANGLTVVSQGEKTVTQVRAHHLCEVAEMREDFDLVFMLVKAYDARWAAELIKPRLAPDGILVGLQNGMMADDIASIVGVERTLGAVIEMASNMFEPGVVNRDTPKETAWFALGALDGGPQERAEEVAEILRAAGNVEVVDDILSAKWMKLVVNATELVSAGVVDLPMVEAADLPGMRAFMVEAGVEALEAALDLGHRALPMFGLTGGAEDGPQAYVNALIDAVYEHYAIPTTLTTVHQDWVKGRRSEVEEINGLVVRERARKGKSAPANAVLREIALGIEAGTETPGEHHLPRLLAALSTD